MKQYQQSYREESQNERQRSFEFEEYPEIQEYYSSQIKSGQEKPKRIIVTEIYDESTPQTKHNLKRQEYFNYFTQSSLPFQSQQGIRNIGQKRLFLQNRNMYLTEGPDMNMNMSAKYNINQIYPDFNKKFFFGGTDLREEYSSPSNERINIRKKIYRGSNTPQPERNTYNFRSDEDFIENFKYYESKNIRDKSDKKYQSITRVTGYSNLIPLNNRRLENSFNSNFNSVNLSQYNNFNKELKHNYSNIDIYKKSFKHQIAEKKKPQTPEKFTKIEIQKTTKNYEIQKKPQPQTKPQTQTITKTTNIQKETSKQKYESKQIPQTTTKTTTVQSETTKRKYESSKMPQTATKTTNIQIQTKKYESSKKPETVAKTTTTTTSTKNVSNINTKKYEVQKKQETSLKSASSQAKTTQKFNKINIDMSKYNRDSNKLVFKTGSGKYKYKDNISEEDIIDSRKNNNSESKNTAKIEVVEKHEKKKETKKLENIGKTSITHTNKTTTSSYNKTDKTDKAAKTSQNNKATVKTNISNLNNKYNTSNSKVTKTTTEIKTTTTKTNTSNNNNTNTNTNKGFKNAYKSTNITTNINLKNTKPNTNSNNNKKTSNITNVSNITKKNYQSNIKVVDAYKEGSNLDKYKKEFIKTEIKRNDMSDRHLSNAKSAKKIFDNRNIGLIESKEIKEIYEMQKKRKEKTPKMKIKKKLLGDNYRYYESKFMQNPNENTNINSYTLHQRRNERVIYGTEEIEVDKMKSYKLRQEMGKHKIKKKKKCFKKQMRPINREEENNYVVYNKYYQDNYNYTGGMGEEEYEFENGDEENNYEEEMVMYYQ